MDPTALDAVTVLKMAHMRRRKSPGLWDLTGSLELGKKSRHHYRGYPKAASDAPLQPVFPSGLFSRRSRRQPFDHQWQGWSWKDRRLLTLNLEDILFPRKGKSSSGSSSGFPGKTIMTIAFWPPPKMENANFPLWKRGIEGDFLPSGFLMTRQDPIEKIIYLGCIVLLLWQQF